MRNDLFHNEIRWQRGVQADASICLDVVGASWAQGGRKLGQGLGIQIRRLSRGRRLLIDAISESRQSVLELRSHLDPKLLAVFADDHRGMAEIWDQFQSQ